MNSINRIDGATPIAQTDLDPTRIARQSSAPPAAGPAASASFSKPGELLSKLQQLQQQDPEKLKEVANDIADSLRKAAAQSGQAAGFLNNLASHFDEVAKTGDLSALQPKSATSTGAVSGHHGHHHGHHGGGPSGDVASAMQDVMNQVDQALSQSSTTTGAAASSDSTTTTT